MAATFQARAFVTKVEWCPETALATAWPGKVSVFLRFSVLR
jgi:hypothetical protein